MRIQAREGIETLIERDGVLVAAEHGTVVAPPEGESGDEIVTVVPVPAELVIATGGTLRGLPAVQARRRRATGWRCARHRLVVLDSGEHRNITMASDWADGPWGGDSVVRSIDFPAGLAN